MIKIAKDIKPITEIKQTGNSFVVTSKTPGKTVTNSFTVGKEADITTMDGKKLKVSNSTSPFDSTERCLQNYFNISVSYNPATISHSQIFVAVMMSCM